MLIIATALGFEFSAVCLSSNPDTEATAAILSLLTHAKEIDISAEAGLRDEMIKKANGKRTIPQIFFDDHHVGGYVELRELEKSGKLNSLLNN